MKKFFIFLSVLVNVVLIGGIVFFTLTPTGKNMLKDYVTKVDTVETVENNNSEAEPTCLDEKDFPDWNKEKTLNYLIETYNSYNVSVAENESPIITNRIVIVYNSISARAKDAWGEKFLTENNLPLKLEKVAQ